MLGVGILIWHNINGQVFWYDVILIHISTYHLTLAIYIYILLKPITTMNLFSVNYYTASITKSLKEK